MLIWTYLLYFLLQIRHHPLWNDHLLFWRHSLRAWDFCYWWYYYYCCCCCHSWNQTNCHGKNWRCAWILTCKSINQSINQSINKSIIKTSHDKTSMMQHFHYKPESFSFNSRWKILKIFGFKMIFALKVCCF